MSVILYFLLFIVVLVVGFFLTIGLSIFRFFGKGTNARTRNRNSDTRSEEDTEPENQHKKVFRKDEGEYIDYDELE